MSDVARGIKKIFKKFLILRKKVSKGIPMGSLKKISQFGSDVWPPIIAYI